MRPRSSRTSTSRRSDEVSIYGWTPEAFIRQGLLRFCFTENDDRSTQVGFVEQVVRTQLARHAHPLENEEGAVVIVTTPHTDSRTFERVVSRRPPAKPAGAGRVIRSWYDLLDLLADKLDPEYGGSLDMDRRDSAGHAHGLPAPADGARPATRTPRPLRRQPSRRMRMSLTVVDIHSLHDAAQRFVVGALVSRVFDEKQGTGREPLRFIVLDELNKYAPREGHGPLQAICSSTSPSAAERWACC